MALLGELFIGISLITALVAIGAFAWGHKLGPKQGESLTNAGYYATFGVLIASTAALTTLAVALWRNDFTIEYVANHHSTDVSALWWLFKLASVWGGREGSLLFWLWLIALFAAWIAYRRMSIAEPLSNISLAVMNFVMAFFLVALMTDINNPFRLSPASWIGPQGELLITGGMNPLLKHWAMMVHPPATFIGYAGFTVAFAFAIGALIVNDPSKLWVEIVDRITIQAWFWLGIGNGIGSVWAYVVLGWGGFWAWDPVENASLLPWLTGVGLLHSFTVYKRRGGYKKWTIMLAVITFVCVLLGAFIVRSGIVQSVHAFTPDSLSFWLFLGMMAFSLVAGLIGIIARGESFKADDEFESLTSREASYYFNNVIMLVATVVIAALTLSPALGGMTYGPATFNAIARPVGILFVFIMAVCPLLAWRRTDGAQFFMRLRWPLLAAAVFFAGLVVLWWEIMWPNHLFHNPGANPWTSVVHTYEALAALAVGALAITTAIYLFIVGAQKRARAKGENFITALGKIIVKNRTQSGGYLAHLGIGIIMLGLVGGAMFVKDVQITIPNEPGQRFEVAGYEFIFQGFEEETLANGDRTSTLVFDVYRDGVQTGQATPGQRQYFLQDQTRFHVSVIVEFLRDIFVVYDGTDQGGNLQLNVKVNPLISWLWFGFGVLSVGSFIAFWPPRRPEPVS